MKNESQANLIKRIAKLARGNQNLEEKIKKLQKENEKLITRLEKARALVEKQSPDDTGNFTREPKEQKSLKFRMATVLFADIQGFSRVMTKPAGTGIMDELDEVFFTFDRIVEKYNIRKIKTIGDTYMATGGVPDKNITNPIEVVMAAMEMRNFMMDFEEGRRERGERIWDIKLGIHTGPVTATTSGRKRVSYDIKGDTVNIASRIEAVSDKNRILISVMTYELVKEFFQCEYYGKLPVKYKGDLDIYQVNCLRPDFSANGQGRVPNDAFMIKFGLIQFTDLQEVILDRLEKKLPSNLYYHNVKHTVDVVTEVELIGWAEGCSDEEILLLKTAALFHDAGHIVSYDEHEYHGTLLAKDFLPAYNYSDKQIERICEIIMATKLPPQPTDLLQQIICDSDLDYLGRSDFVPVSNTLYDELKAQNKIGTLNDWNKLQVKFISGHRYFTRTARSLREVNKQKQIERIQSIIT